MYNFHKEIAKIEAEKRVRKLNNRLVIATGILFAIIIILFSK